MARKKGKIFVVSAPSGSGKTTLCTALAGRSRKITQSVSMTTRPPRRGEKNGRDYYFVTEREFRKDIEKGRFLEWDRNFGNFYGTPRRHVEDSLKKGKDVILSIDVKGAMQVKKSCPEAVFIFIKPPTFSELKKRLKKRNTEREASISERLEVAKKEMAYASKYNYVIVNDSLSKATKRLKYILESERCKNNGISAC